MNVMQVAPAMRPEEVLAMDALLAIALIGARLRQIDRQAALSGSAAGNRDGETYTNAKGQRVVQIGSMETLAKVLQGGT